MAESFENSYNVYNKDKYIKKYFRGIKLVREALSSRKRKDKAVSFLASCSSGLQSSETKPNKKIGLRKLRTIALSHI